MMARFVELCSPVYGDATTRASNTKHTHVSADLPGFKIRYGSSVSSLAFPLHDRSHPNSNATPKWPRVDDDTFE